MSDTTPDSPAPRGAGQPEGAEPQPAPATAPAESAAAEAPTAAAAPAAAAPAASTAPEAPSSAEPTDTDPDMANPPSNPVSARGHVNRPAADEAAVQQAPAAEKPAAVIEPEPVVATDDGVAAAVARSAEEPAATAGGSATVDEATPVQSATPVIAAAEAAHLHEASSTATAAYGSARPGEAAWAPEPTGAGVPPAGAQPVPPQPVAPIYLQRPEPPKKKSNRGVGILIVLVGTIAFALLWSVAVVVVGALLTPSNEYLTSLLQFYTGGVAFGLRGWAPVLAFFIGMVVLVQIVNRARWWAYILGGLVVAVFVYFVYVGASLVEAQAWTRTPEEFAVLMRTAWVNPFAVLAGVIAREISVWTGAWLAARGRKLKARNAEAQADYEQQVADQQNQAVNAYAGGTGY